MSDPRIDSATLNASLRRLSEQRDDSDLFAFEYEDFRLESYSAWPGIKAPIAV